MKYLMTLLSLFSLLGCAAPTRVVPVSDHVYRITETGGWGANLASLKHEVMGQAQRFAEAAGRDFEIIDESVSPETQVDVYPAYDDTYSLTFRLVDRPRN